MKATFLFGVLFLVSTWTYAQQVILRGQIFIHNSKYNTGTIKYVEKASVSASFGGFDNTDDRGQFTLEFVGYCEGTSVRVRVEKFNLEVVNGRDLRDVVVGRKERLKVYMAEKGHIDQAKTELEGISLQAMNARYEALILQLRQGGEQSQQIISELARKFNLEIKDRQEAEDILKNQLEATQKRIPEIALRLARVNLDFASEMYKEAYEYFKKGEIEKAIEALDEDILDVRRDSLVNLIQRGRNIKNMLDSAKDYERERLNQIIKGRLLKAKTQAERGAYETALSIYIETTEFLEKNDIKEALVDAYSEIATLSERLGALQATLKYKKKIIPIISSPLISKKAELAKHCQDIVRIYLQEEQLDSAIYYQQKAYDILNQGFCEASILETERHQLTTLIEQYAQALQQKRKWNEALIYYEHLLSFPLGKSKKKELKKIIKQLQKK